MLQTKVMKLPNPCLNMPKHINQCLIYATAWLLNTPPQVIINFLEKTGEEKDKEGKMIGVHIDEIIDFFFLKGFMLCRITPNPASENGSPIFDPQKSTARTYSYLQMFDALIIEPRHAVSWSHVDKIIYSYIIRYGKKIISHIDIYSSTPIRMANSIDRILNHLCYN